MQKTKRLHRRITFGFLLFGAVLTLIFGVGLIIALKIFETSVLDDILYAELTEFQRQNNNAARASGASPSRATIDIFTAPLDAVHSLPDYSRDLSQGSHDVTYKDRKYRILVKHSDDTRYIVQFDDTSILQRERDFIHLVWLCSIVILLIAFITGYGMSHRIIHPIRQLASQVTAFKNQPDESLDLSEFSDDEIGVLARKLQHYHEQLKHLLIREKEFASNVSHELRTPVTSISMAAEVLATNKNLSPIESARIKRIQRAVGEISELIETFLILAQIDNESAKYIHACNMVPIVRKVIEQQSVWLGDKPVTVRVKENEKLEVSGHPGILSVLVANLVRNAFRYTEQGSITVTLTSNQLTVSDTGVGIDLPLQTQIFKRHVKANTEDTNIGGLGLAIVQRICERYGWKVFFQSTKGQGSQFSVLFKA